MRKLVIYNGSEHDFNEEYMYRLNMPQRNLPKNKLRWNLPDGFHPMNPMAYFSAWKGEDPDWEAKAVAMMERNQNELAGAPPVDPTFKAEREGFRIQ